MLSPSGPYSVSLSTHYSGKHKDKKNEMYYCNKHHFQEKHFIIIQR
jgi:hypothetical protein